MLNVVLVSVVMLGVVMACVIYAECRYALSVTFVMLIGIMFSVVVLNAIHYSEWRGAEICPCPTRAHFNQVLYINNKRLDKHSSLFEKF